MKALHAVLTGYRAVLKRLLVPKVFFGFITMKLGIKKAPGSPLLDKLKADVAAQKKAKEENDAACGAIPLKPA
jgi:hypothetical protein